MAASSKKFQKKNPKGDKKTFNKASKKQFTMKKGDAVKSEAVALQLEDDVPDFPRGFTYFFFQLSVWFSRIFFNFLIISLE